MDSPDLTLGGDPEGAPGRAGVLVEFELLGNVPHEGAGGQLPGELEEEAHGQALQSIWR